MSDNQKTAFSIEIQNLSVGYEATPIVAGLEAAIPIGAQVGVVGPNGAGKSTLFRTLVGQLPPMSGQILIDGQPLGQHGANVAYVPQRSEVDWKFPVTVFDVVMMGRYNHIGWLRRPSQNDRHIVLRCLEQLGIRELASRPIGELSGGQQQRVFLARALAQEPTILVLDEPFSGVDAPSKQIALDLLHALRPQGITVLVSTHDLALASTRFDYLMLLNHRQVAFGAPDTILNSMTLAATFGDQLLVYQQGNNTIALTDQYCSAACEERASGE
jgi:ABC-type Mn2+/Zn2+ transport system ATPase subunit